MTFLPVVERELRVAARRRGTYWGRLAAAVIGSALAAYVLLASHESNEKVGATLFAVVSWVVFLYAAVTGTLVTCDCLSEEKREGTLGLLFLTDLKGHDVVLGKLAATSVNAFYGMLAVLPMLAIPFILGGVSRAEMLRVVLVAISLLFFFLSIGLFVSSICRRDNWGLGLSAMIGLIFVAGGPMASRFNPHAPTAQIEMLSSPAVGCIMAFDDVYTTQPHDWFWFNVATTEVDSLVFFGLACLIVPRSWQEGWAGKRMPWQRRIDPVRRARNRTALLEINPFLWRISRSGRKRLLIWLTLAVLTLLWWRYGRLVSPRITDPGMDLLLLVPAGLILKAWIAAEASRTFSEDRRSGGMELLLTTPLREKDIIRGQMLSLWHQFGGFVAALLLANAAFVLSEFRAWDSVSRPYMLATHLLAGGFLVTDMMALSWDGAWLGLLNRKPNRAALLALTRIMALPTVSFVALVCLSGLLPQPKGTDSFTDVFFVFWLLLGLAADLYFGLSARSKLRAEFRTIVSEGFNRKHPAEPTLKSAPELAEAQ